MEKVSIGRSVARAYGFLFAQFFQIIGLAWLPASFYAAGCFFWLKNASRWMPADEHTVMAGLQTVGFLLLAIFAALILRAVVANALTQQAFGIRTDFALAHFVIGPRETRLFSALVRFFVIFVVFYVAWILLSALGMYAVKHFAAAGSVVASATTVRGVSLLPILVGAISLALLITFVFSMLRLGFLLAPVAAVEPHVTLTRSWALSRRSAWRLLAVYLCVLVPVALVAGVAIWLLTGSDLLAALHVMTTAKLRDPKILDHFGADHALVLACVSGLVFVLMAALQAGAMAEAYRAVTGHEEPESEDDDALVASLLTPAAPMQSVSITHDDHDHDGHGGAHEPPMAEHEQGGHDDAAPTNAAAHEDHSSHDAGAHAEPEPAHDQGGHVDAGHHGHSEHAPDEHGHEEHGHGDQPHDDHGSKDHGHEGHDDHGHDSHHASHDVGHAEQNAMAESGVLDTAGLQQVTQEEHSVAA